MMAQNLNVQKGRCINFGNCSKANDREEIEVNLGDDFICPECECDLMALPPIGGVHPSLKWIFIIVGAIVVICVVGYLGYKFLLDNDKSTDNDISEMIEKEEQVAEPSHPITPDGIILDKTSLEFEDAEASEQLIATVFPSDVPEKNSTIIWRSGDETVATVDSIGLVTAVANGSVVIAAYTLNGLSATCYVTVGNVEQEDVAEEQKKKNKTIDPDDNPIISGTVLVNGGTYTGMLKNGKPHRTGTIRYSSRTLIDSRDLKQRYAEAGYTLTGEFYEGRLLQGKLYDNEGEFLETIIIGRGVY